jgi:hypothetical protein
MQMTLRRFSSVKIFFAFTLRALTKRSSQQQSYLDARDLKSTWSGPKRSIRRRGVSARNHSIRPDSLNAMVRSRLPVESRIRISPERKLAGVSASSIASAPRVAWGRKWVNGSDVPRDAQRSRRKRCDTDAKQLWHKATV